jgi:hypothetical protein
MPAQQRRWRDHEPVPAPLRQQSSKRSDEGTIGGPKPRTPILASQHRELVPKQHQLSVLGELGPSTPNEQPQNSNEGKVGRRRGASTDPPRRSQRPHGGQFLRRQRFLVFVRARETRDGGVPRPSSDRDTHAEPDRPESTRRGRKAPLDTAESKLERRNRVLTPFTLS